MLGNSIYRLDNPVCCQAGMHWCKLTRIQEYAASCRLGWFLKYSEPMISQFLLRAIQNRRIAGDSIRLYFAPLVGALMGIRVEYRSSVWKTKRRPTIAVSKRNSKSYGDQW